MDIDFLVQDTYALTRPQWKLATSFEEAGRAFADLVAQNNKSQGTEKAIDTEPTEDGVSSSDEADEDEPPVPEMEDGQSSSEEIEAEVGGISWAKRFADRINSRLRMVTPSLGLILMRTSS